MKLTRFLHATKQRSRNNMELLELVFIDTACWILDELLLLHYLSDVGRKLSDIIMK